MHFGRPLTLLTLLSLAACVAPPPAVTVAANHGVIRADTREAAEELGAAYDRAFGRVRELVPNLGAEHAEVWEQAQLAYYSGRPLGRNVGGFTMRRQGRIHILPTEEPLRSQILALPDVSGLCLDLTSKPPGTIEWE